MGLALARYGISPATGYAAGAARYPRRLALVDDDGALTWREVDVRTDRLASELRARGLREGDAAGLLARNGRGLVEGAVALAKVGADVLYLGTGTAAGPLRAGARPRARPRGPARRGARRPRRRRVAGGSLRHDRGARRAGAARSTAGPPPVPRHTSRQVILTSGTTGAAARRGPQRRHRRGRRRGAVAASRCGRGETTVIAAPAFHAWGLGHVSLAMLLGSTVVLSRRFDPERVLRRRRASTGRRRWSSSRSCSRACSRPSRARTTPRRCASSPAAAAPCRATWSQRVQARFGPVLHNLYGSTEVAYAAVATPEDLAADPRTAGRPPYGVTLRVVDERGPRRARRARPGASSSAAGWRSSGYTDGSDKDRLDGLVATGDLGVLDDAGRLTVLGRDDDMVVIGGENVYPGQVEDVLAAGPVGGRGRGRSTSTTRRTARGSSRTSSRPRRAGRRRAPAGARARPAGAVRRAARGARRRRAAAQRDGQGAASASSRRRCCA